MASATRSPFSALLARIDHPGARRAWEVLDASSPQRSVYSSLVMAETIGEVLGLDPRLAVVSHDGRPQAGAILYLKRRWPYTAAALPPLAAVHSPLLDGPLPEAGVHRNATALDALVEAVEAEVHQATFALHPSITDARTFAWRGWAVHTIYTYRLSLEAGVDVTACWSENPLRLLKKGDGELSVDEEPAAIPEIVDLVRGSLARQDQAAGMRADQMTRLAASLASAGLARPFVARRGSAAEAGAVILSDGHTAYYWLAGSMPGPGMTVLLARALERLRDEGVRHFDFVGANTPSVAEFKRRFGAELVPYFRVRKLMRPELRLLQRLRGN